MTIITPQIGLQVNVLKCKLTFFQVYRALLSRELIDLILKVVIHIIKLKEKFNTAILKEKKKKKGHELIY